MYQNNRLSCTMILVVEINITRIFSLPTSTYGIKNHSGRLDSCFKIMGSALDLSLVDSGATKRGSVEVDGKCWLRYPIINCSYLGASRALTSSLAVTAPSCLNPFT